jgi:phytoene synthase
MGLNSALVGDREGAFATPMDYEECRRLHKRHGTTYYFASQFFAPHIRKQTHALYGFVRMPDEWVDNPDCDLAETRVKLQDFRSELLSGFRGVVPTSGPLRAFCDVVSACNIPNEEPLLFLDCMEQDLETNRYATYRDLQGYMRGSACAVGVMMCHILSSQLDPECLSHAMALGEAMQLTNFLRDVGEDARRGRIYLPLEDLARFDVTEDEIFSERVTEPFRNLMRFEIERTRTLYRRSEAGIDLLPPYSRKAVRLSQVLYSRILARIEQNEFDVFSRRARTSRFEKLRVAGSVVSGIGNRKLLLR